MQWKTGSTVVKTRRRLTRPRVFRWHEMSWCGQPTPHWGLRCEEGHFELYEKDCVSPLGLEITCITGYQTDRELKPLR